MGEPQAQGIGLAVLIGLVAWAVLRFVRAHALTEPYEPYETEDIDTTYGVTGLVRERKAQYAPKHTRRLSVGIMLCVLSPLPLFLSLMFGDNDPINTAAVGMLLVLVAVVSLTL